MPTLHIDFVQCLNQNEPLSDEIYFVLWDNGNKEYKTFPIRGDVDGGEDWNPNIHWQYDTSVTFFLFEDDGITGDDLIGSKTLVLPNRGDGDEVFSKSGAEYYVGYHIT